MEDRVTESNSNHIIQKQPEAEPIKRASRKRTFLQQTHHENDPNQKKMAFRGDHYSAGTPSECRYEFERLEIEMYGRPKVIKKQESLEEFKEMIEAVVREPLQKIANSVDRAIKLVTEAK